MPKQGKVANTYMRSGRMWEAMPFSKNAGTFPCAMLERGT